MVRRRIIIGSTTCSLSKRSSHHKSSAKENPNRNVYKQFNSMNWENVKIVLIEEHNLESKEQLLREEDRVICLHKNNPKCLNQIRAYITDEEMKIYKQIYNSSEKYIQYKNNFYDLFLLLIII